MHRVGLYAGTFDPITNGHLDIIRRSVGSLCDQLIIAIGINPAKKPMFSESKRVELIESAIAETMGFEFLREEIGVATFEGLLVDFGKKEKVNIIIRGIRSVSDFEYELNLFNVNATLAPDIQTVFLPTRPELAVVSSSMVKELARHKSDISKFVPKSVANAVYNVLNPSQEK